MKYIVYEYDSDADGEITPYINNVQICDNEAAAKEIVSQRLAAYKAEGHGISENRVYEDDKAAEEYSDSWIDICIAPANV